MRVLGTRPFKPLPYSNNWKASWDLPGWIEDDKEKACNGGPLILTKKAKTVDRAVGLGGIFFKARNPRKLSDWYQKHLGIKTTQNTALFTWRSPKASKRIGYTVWSIFPANTRYFHNPRKQFMINYRVRNLKLILEKLRRERVKVARKVEDSKYGRFAWVSDPEGNWLELWEPPRNYKAPEEEMPMQ